MVQYPHEGLLVWYHGPVPVDYMGLVARLLRDSGRRVVSVVDRCLDLLPGLDMVREHMRWPHPSNTSASNEGYPKIRIRIRILGEGLKAATTAFTCKTLLRHYYAERALTPRSLNVK